MRNPYLMAGIGGVWRGKGIWAWIGVAWRGLERRGMLMRGADWTGEAGELSVPQVEVAVYGLREIDAAVTAAASGSFVARTVAPGLSAMARVVRVAARRRDYGFRDRRRRLGYPAELGGGQYRDLRSSIRSRRIAATYFGQRIRSGRAAVFGGGSGARQAYLVEAGHGGPRPARPHSFLRRALLGTESQQGSEFQRTVRSRWPRIAMQIARRTQTFSAQASFGRTLARRARSR